MIVATAGHVDHGKTSLIRQLTGVDTDRLPEEKKRGLSIDLGFAYLPTDDDISIGFIDVPGHEKFVRNMIAGVAAIDLGLLVVAADDGVMPQTREHLAILTLLGIPALTICVSKIDLVSEQRVRQVEQDIASVCSDAGFSRCEIFALSTQSGDGVDALREALVSRARLWRATAAQGHFRMAIDRSFSVQGAGTVVTGTVVSLSLIHI